MEVPELAKLRARLDRIDGDFLRLLHERIQCCVEIAHVKRVHQVPMMQPHRIGVVKQRAAGFGEQHGIDQQFLSRLYDLVIAETCRVENLVIDAPAG
jgi:4-amino-4-deoxychorismate mutase